MIPLVATVTLGGHSTYWIPLAILWNLIVSSAVAVPAVSSGSSESGPNHQRVLADSDGLEGQRV